MGPQLLVRSLLILALLLPGLSLRDHPARSARTSMTARGLIDAENEPGIDLLRC